MRFKVGEEVLVTSGKDKGKRGKVERVFPERAVVLVAGVNLYKKHVKNRDERTKTGGVVMIAKPLPVGNIAVVCPKCTQPTRVGVREVGGKKIRFCKKCGEELNA